MIINGINLGSAHLSDEDFLAAFESCSLPNSQFHHADHVRLTWLYVCRQGEESAAKRVIEGIQRYANFNGAVRKFNFTQTRAWVRLVSHACENQPETMSFQEFAAAHPKLLDKNALSGHYSKQLLESDEARVRWVEPDLLPLP